MPVLNSSVHVPEENEIASGRKFTFPTNRGRSIPDIKLEEDGAKRRAQLE